MKRFAALVLSMSMLLSLASCSGNPNIIVSSGSDNKTAESSMGETSTTTNEDDTIDDAAWDGLKSIG